jgi:hypothetical protein
MMELMTDAVLRKTTNGKKKLHCATYTVHTVHICTAAIHPTTVKTSWFHWRFHIMKYGVFKYLSNFFTQVNKLPSCLLTKKHADGYRTRGLEGIRSKKDKQLLYFGPAVSSWFLPVETGVSRVEHATSPPARSVLLVNFTCSSLEQAGNIWLKLQWWHFFACLKMISGRMCQ